MKSISTKSDSSQPAADTAVYLFDDWFDPIEAGVRDRVREFIQAMVEGELDATLMRRRYGRRPKSTSDDDDGLVAVTGHRHGHRSRSLTGPPRSLMSPCWSTSRRCSARWRRTRRVGGC